MDQARAQELLSAAREQIEEQLRNAAIEPNEELSTNEIADEASDTYQNEYDQGRIDELREQLAAVERAEQRLRDGSFGRSVESGEPIPDARLEALPTAERTVEEEAARAGRG
ncbi:MAG: DnaK suppressor protein [Gaiellales bacterium]|jgi:DnaK suppressor protein|nr:DnaK suppressor protein [Gaiellales bacterium]MDX6545267.1 DnaK suppressor protein [Gaiellales bacterium]MDX6550192.1 DnaK suppressor protein [Gaiellales bacterium]